RPTRNLRPRHRGGPLRRRSRGLSGRPGAGAQRAYDAGLRRAAAPLQGTRLGAGGDAAGAGAPSRGAAARDGRRTSRPRAARRRRGPGRNDARRRPGGRGVLLVVVKVLVSVLLFGCVLGRSPLSGVAETVRHASPVWLAAAAVVLVASNVLGSWQWDHLLN